tara:strand:+ start:17283 stop:18641 length:1359 start_codon:yes stop_codon:yes gene_type:complete
LKKISLFLIICIYCINIKAQNFTIELFSSGFDFPLDIQSAGDERLFIVEKEGLIKIVNSDGSVLPTPFIDLTTIIDSGGEGGLLGIAFHPNYISNGYFYVSYINLNRDTQISRFEVSSGDPNVANASSELSILNYERNGLFHYGGAISFGPDGYLYIASGDDNYPIESQNTSSFLGKLLRIDVDNPAGGNNYGIPPDNPFAGSTTELEEIWALGLRNPWKFSFDNFENTIWIADVGESTMEEINRVSIAEGGFNFGWPCYEGSHLRTTDGCPPMNLLEFPISEYSHDIGYSVTGGYVYRGTQFPEFYGKYIFADYGTDILGWVDENDDIYFTSSYEKNWSSLGLNNQGEIYLAALFSGEIYKVELVLSVIDNSKSGILIFPNPATNEVSIKIEDNRIKKIKILDINGKELISQVGNSIHETTINLSNFSKGFYIVIIENSLGIKIPKKLIIK